MPPAVEALILQMLEKDARLRPEARAVAAALDALENGSATPVPFVASQRRRETVGREAERALIAEAAATVTSGRGLMIGITADAGLGKTTFVDDVLAGLGPDSWIVARGRCSERLAGTEAYLPFLEAFETLLRGADRATTVGMVKATAPNWYLQVMPLATMADDTSGVRLLEARATSQERLKREMAAVLAEVTRLKPLVLFFDDLHWADVSTIDLLAYLATKFDTMRVLVIATLRPAELQIAKHPFLQVRPTLLSRGSYREIELGFLSKDDVERYLANQFPEHQFPPPVAAMIHARTEGYPLFMADLTRYLSDRGIIGQRDGQWRLLQPISEIDGTLPDTVLGMVQRKIDQVPENDRRLLVTASVQGYEFDSAVISRAAGEDPSAVEERLEALERVFGIVHIMGERELPDGQPNLRCRFVHGLYQNALYRSLRPTRRSTLSATVADALLASHGDEHVTIASDLASLFEVARDNRRAAHFFLMAAQNALRVFAHREVALLASRGLERLKGQAASHENEADEIGLQFLLAIARTATLGYGDVETGTAFERLRELTQAAGHEPQYFQALSGLFFFDLLRANLAQARRTGEQLVGMAEARNDPMSLVGAYYAYGQVLNFMGDLAPALDFEDRAIAAHEPQLASRYWSMYPFNPGLYAMTDSARTLWLLGYPDRGLSRARAAVVEARTTRDLRSQPQTILLCAAQHIFRREPAEASRVAQEALALSEQHELPLEGAWTRFVLGWASAKLQDGNAIEGMRIALDLLDTFNARVGVKTYFGLLMADVLIDAGDLDDAMAFLTEGLSFAEVSDDRQWEAEQYRLIGEILRRQGDRDGADEAMRRALEIASRQGALSLELRAAASLVRLRDDEAARGRLAALVARFTEGFDTPDLVEARALVARA